ncbi:MAG: hypothetical protein RIR70_1156 [Pseudomonadota bacterium]|jgi:flagellar protein FliO/FliZ
MPSLDISHLSMVSATRLAADRFEPGSVVGSGVGWRLPLSVMPMLGASSPVLAAESSAGYTFVSVLMLAMLAAAVAALAWLMKRNAVGGAASSMRLVAAQALGPRERLVVVHVGSRFFLLGHTPQQITMLTELSPEDVPQPGGRLPENLFADLLKKIKK